MSNTYVPQAPPLPVRVVAAATTGVLLGCSFPPYPFATLAWIALVPILFLWERHRSARALFVDLYAAMLVTFAVAFQWPLFHALPTTAFLSIPGLLLLPMWMALPLAISLVFRRRLGTGAGLGAMSALYLVMELGLRRGPLAVPWSLLGHTQADLYPVNQLAAYGGVPALTLFVLLANVAFFLALRPRELRLPTAVRLSSLAGAVALLLLVPAALPDAPSSTERESDPADEITIGLVQPAVDAPSWADLHDRARVDKLIEISERLVDESGPIDLLVWPETALPPVETYDVHAQPASPRPTFAETVEDRGGRGGSRSIGREAVEDVRAWVRRHGTSLLTGAITSNAGRFRNSALLVSPASADQAYHKRRLVPFAEQVPFQEHFPWLRRVSVPSGGVPWYVPGRDHAPLKIRDRSVGVLICFESLFADLARSYAREGAGILVAITQSGWWGNSFGYRQHLAFNRLRAIETGLPLVQVSVSGVTALIRPNGHVERQTGWMEESAWSTSVRPGGTRTPYVRFGDTLSLLAVLAIGVLIIPVLRRNP